MVTGGEVSRSAHREPLVITDHALPWPRVQETPCSAGAEPTPPRGRRVRRRIGDSASLHGADVTTDPRPRNDVCLLPVPQAPILRVMVQAPGLDRLSDRILTKIYRFQCQLSSNGAMTTRPHESAPRDEW